MEERMIYDELRNLADKLREPTMHHPEYDDGRYDAATNIDIVLNRYPDPPATDKVCKECGCPIREVRDSESCWCDVTIRPSPASEQLREAAQAMVDAIDVKVKSAKLITAYNNLKSSLLCYLSESEKLRDAIEIAAKWFDAYAINHRLNGDDTKAETNEFRARWLRKSITRPPQETNP